MFITRYTSCSRMFKEDFARPLLTDQRQSTRDEKKIFKNINETLLKQLGPRIPITCRTLIEFANRLQLIEFANDLGRQYDYFKAIAAINNETGRRCNYLARGSNLRSTQIFRMINNNCLSTYLFNYLGRRGRQMYEL